MKSLFSVTAIILLSVNIFAQQDYFNKRYDFNQSAWEGGLSILATDTGSVTVVASTNYPGLGGQLLVGLMCLDDTGMLQQAPFYGIPFQRLYAGGWGSLLKINNQTLILPGSTQDTLGNDDAVLTRIDSLNITWQHTYGDSLFQAGRAVKKTRDGGFILVGDEAPYSSSNSDVLMVKTDSNGIEEWTMRYGGQYSELGLDLDTCYDGGAILCGRSRSYGINASVFWGNAYAIKTDSAGNELWSRTFGNIYDDRFWSCLQSKDGNYVFAGYYTYYDPYWPNYCCRSQCKPYIVKLDTAGNTLWEKVYGEIFLEHSITSIKELPNGDYISVGYLHYPDSIGSDWRGFILKTTGSGDSLWYYTYRGVYGGNSDSFLYDVALDDDNGFLATGFVVPQTPDTGNQDIWVLKVDSNGCEVSNCLYTSSGEIINNLANEISFYPNPSTGIYFLKNNSGEAIESVEIYNQTGEKVLQRTEGLTQLNLLTMPAGIYYYAVTTKTSKRYSGKLMKN